MKKNIQKQIALSLLLILLMLLAVSAVSSFALSGAVDAPVVIDPKNNISILMEAKEGTTEGTRELKESGTIVSVKEENTFTVTAFSKNYNTKLHMIYTVNGEDVPVDGDKFEYVCRSEEDYKPLTVRVYDEKNEQLGEFTFQLEYKEVGFFRNLFLTVTGNKTIQEIWRVTKEEMPFAIFETFYVTILSTVFSLILGLPLGVLLVVGDKKGILPFPRWLMSFLNMLINLLRSIPFLILMIMVIPLSRLIVGTSVGTVATIIPLVFAAFPFVARLVETSLREVNPNIIEGHDSRKCSFPRLQCDHCGDYHFGLFRHERSNRRRRIGADCHQLRLLSVSVCHHGGGGDPADRSGADIPEHRNGSCKEVGQTPEIKKTRLGAEGKR